MALHIRRRTVGARVPTGEYNSRGWLKRRANRASRRTGKRLLWEWENC